MSKQRSKQRSEQRSEQLSGEPPTAERMAEYQRAWAELMLRGKQTDDLTSSATFEQALNDSNLSDHFKLHQYDALCVYESLLKGGVRGAFEGLFPKTAACFTADEQRDLLERYRLECPNPSPQFVPMFESLASWLAEKPDVSDGVAAMATYEWAMVSARHAGSFEELLNHKMLSTVTLDDLVLVQAVFNPTLSLIQADWPLHECSGKSENWPEQSTSLFVFRHHETHQTKTLATNDLTLAVVERSGPNGLNGPSVSLGEALIALKEKPEYAHLSEDVLLAQGTSLWNNLLEMGVVIGFQLI